jgi:G6PDH family F420-dependent oxidoreductase
MSDVGYTLSSEEFGPSELVEQASRAETVGFDFLSISDHFHPWLEAQGEAPFVWSTLGGVARATDEIDVGVGVTCPTFRVHPVNVAQAVATVATMLDGRRFSFGVGTGELLNEHVTGEHWPTHRVRLEMLREAVEIIRQLWEPGQTSYHGTHFTVENARIFTRPEEFPPICVSAFGEQTARAAAEFGDGFWSVGPQGDLLDAYRKNDGEGESITQIHVCYADDEDEAVSTAHEQWANSALPGELAQVLPTTTHFEQATEMVTEEDIREGSILTDADPGAHVENIRSCFDEGFDKVYVHQIGDDQASFFDFYEEEVLPAFD